MATQTSLSHVFFSSHTDERGSESPILNLTKPGGQNSSHLGSSGTRGPGSESPLSDAAAPNSSALAGATGATGRGGGRASSGGGIELSDDDDDDDLSDTNEKKEANNNKESSGVTATGGSDSATATGATPTSLAAMAGFPGLAALGSGAEATSGGNQLNSVYGLIGSIQALLKMAVENAKQEERQSMSQKRRCFFSDSLSSWSANYSLVFTSPQPTPRLT